jgi:hypothetical protein
MPSESSVVTQGQLPGTQESSSPAHLGSACPNSPKLVDRAPSDHLSASPQNLGHHAMPDLKLLALDSEDLEVISATTQDAVVRVGDMGFARADRRFALLMNRFAWEEGGKTPQRKRTALHFDRVNDVKVQGIDLNAVDGVLDLLAITFSLADEPAGRVDLDFAGGGTIRLDVECLEARLQDLGAAWAAKATPTHA